MEKKIKVNVIEWEENSKAKTFPPFVDKVHLDMTSGNLTFFNLASSDEDEYEIEPPSIKDNIKFIL